MKKLLVLIIILFFILVSFIFYFNFNGTTGSAVAEGNKVVLYEFYGKGCPHCDRLSYFLDNIQDKYPTLVIKKYEIYFNEENRKIFYDMAEAFDIEVQGVPTVFIDDKVISGFSKSIGVSIEEEIQKCLIEECGDPIIKVKTEETTEIVGESSPLEDPEKTELKKKVTIPVVIGAAAVDAINPCAFAVLILLLGTILVSGIRKKALLAGLAFTLAIYISYFLMGVGLYSAIGATGITHTFYIIVAILAILVGLFNLKDYLWYGKWFVMEVPLKWRPKMKGLIRGITSVPGAFLIGFVISLFLLPCTSGPYIVILGLLAKVATRDTALLLLLLYNFVFILPMLIITLLIYFGFTTTEKAEEWRTKKLKILHLIAGIIILLLGIGMLMAVFLGMI